MGEESYSDVVREIAEYLGAANAYEKVTDLFHYLLGQSLGKNAVQLMVAKDAEDVEAYYEQKAAPEVSEEGCILVAQADGKGAPLVKSTEAMDKVRLGKGEKRSKKKEAVVTSVYTIEPNPRQPEEVVASLFRQERAENEAEKPKARSKPQHKEVWATLEGKDAALGRLASRVEKREGEHIRVRVALTDGAEALQKRVLLHLPDGVIEGACRHLVKDRFELTGMRWTQAGAESLLHLRAVAENDDWEDHKCKLKQIAC